MLEPTINGNKLVKENHLFVPEIGCFFPTLEIAKKFGLSKNGVGYWEKNYIFDNKIYYQVGNTNQFD